MADLNVHQSDGLWKKTVIMSACVGIQYSTLCPQVVTGFPVMFPFPF